MHKCPSAARTFCFPLFRGIDKTHDKIYTDYNGGKVTDTASIFSQSEDIAVVTFDNGYSLDLGFSGGRICKSL